MSKPLRGGVAIHEITLSGLNKLSRIQMCFTSYDVQELASGGRDHQDPVVSSVGDHQPLAAVVHGNLPWKRQHAGGQGVSQQLDAQLMLLQLAALPVVAQGGACEECQLVAVALAHHREEQVATRAQQDQRGPAGHLQLVPEERLAIVDHRVADVVAEHGAADVVDDLKAWPQVESSFNGTVCVGY